jgi:Polysaccharide lyase
MIGKCPVSHAPRGAVDCERRIPLMMRSKTSLVGLALLLGGVLGCVAPSKAADLFREDFESGTLGWDGPTKKWNRSSNGIVQQDAQGTVSRDGSWGMRSHIEFNPNGSVFRAELGQVEFNGVSPNPVREVDAWYGLSIFLPDPYPADSYVEALAQWHSGNQATMLLEVVNGNWRLLNQYDYGSDGPVARRTHDIGSYSGDVGKWTDWVLHVRWNWDSSGMYELWKNGRKVLGPVTGKNLDNDPMIKNMPRFKWGIYKPRWQTGTHGTVTSRTVFHDGYRMAFGSDASYADVAPGAGARPQPPHVSLVP